MTAAKPKNGAEAAPEAAVDGVEVAPPDKPPRRRGRPPGQPKTGGRKAGSKNWSSPEIRAALIGKSEAIDTLADICAGRQLLVSGPTGKEVWRRPTMPERLQALQLVMKKVIPDLQATELTGKDGKDLLPAPVENNEHGRRQLGRAILQVLGSGLPDAAAAVGAGGGEAVSNGASPSLPSEPVEEPHEPPRPGEPVDIGNGFTIELQGGPDERWTVAKDGEAVRGLRVPQNRAMAIARHFASTGEWNLELDGTKETPLDALVKEARQRDAEIDNSREARPDYFNRRSTVKRAYK